MRSVSLSFESHVQCEAKNRRRWKSELTVQTCRSAMRALEANKRENLCAWIIEVWLGSNTYLLLNLLLPHWSSSLLKDSGLSAQSDDSGWARRRGVWVWRGRKVPEEPLAFTLPSLVQVVLLVTLFACSLVVVILFKVPHRRPTMFLKILLVLCSRINHLPFCVKINFGFCICIWICFKHGHITF